MATSTTPVSQVPLAQALSQFELFKDLTEAEMQWFIQHASDEWYEEGTQVVRQGDPADAMTVIVEGMLRFQMKDPGSPAMFARPGQATGLLPYSRLRNYNGNAYAIQPLRIARIHRDLFPEMMQRIPELGPRLVGVMSDRIRETVRLSERRATMKALGKLAAGLAHELNNPASAAQRSAHDLRHWFKMMQESNQFLAERGFDATQFQCLLEIERELIRQVDHRRFLETLERSDNEESLAQWLRSRGVERAWECAPFFVEAAATTKRLSEIAECFAPATREAVFTRIAATLAIDRITTGIQATTQQMSELVRAVKEYSFVDQAPEQDVDIESGIENTLSVLNHRLRRGVALTREYDGRLPRIQGSGSELNQVWTHLIDNALDAMNGGGGTLRIRTACEAGMILVQITDSGTGISPDIRDRIFDPFFTTKEVGMGRGLGLDVAFRVVQMHRGDIQFISKPGETTFEVRLPTNPMTAF
jgi:signal transduction histidine kinase